MQSPGPRKSSRVALSRAGSPWSACLAAATDCNPILAGVDPPALYERVPVRTAAAPQVEVRMRILDELPDAAEVLPPVSVGLPDRTGSEFPHPARSPLLRHRGPGAQAAALLRRGFGLHQVFDADEAAAGVACPPWLPSEGKSHEVAAPGDLALVSCEDDEHLKRHGDAALHVLSGDWRIQFHVRLNEWRVQGPITAATVLTIMDTATGERIAVSGSNGTLAAWSAFDLLESDGDVRRW